MLFTGLLLVSGLLIKDRHDHPDKCEINPFCKDCSDLKTCTLPQAKKVKNHGKEKKV